MRDSVKLIVTKTIFPAAAAAGVHIGTGMVTRGPCRGGGGRKIENLRRVTGRLDGHLFRTPFDVRFELDLASVSTWLRLWLWLVACGCGCGCGCGCTIVACGCGLWLVTCGCGYCDKRAARKSGASAVHHRSGASPLRFAPSLDSSNLNSICCLCGYISRSAKYSKSQLLRISIKPKH